MDADTLFADSYGCDLSLHVGIALQVLDALATERVRDRARIRAPAVVIQGGYNYNFGNEKDEWLLDIQALDYITIRLNSIPEPIPDTDLIISNPAVDGTYAYRYTKAQYTSYDWSFTFLNPLVSYLPLPLPRIKVAGNFYAFAQWSVRGWTYRNHYF